MIEYLYILSYLMKKKKMKKKRKTLKTYFSSKLKYFDLEC